MTQKTIKELKLVCGDIVPFRDLTGKVVLCKHLNDWLCGLPGRFDCVVMSYLNRLDESEHTSYSQCSKFLGCPLKYYYDYVAKVPVERYPSWAWLGNTFHECAANIDLGKPWAIGPIPENSKTTEYERAALSPILSWYEQNHGLFAPAIDCEVKMEFETPKKRRVIGFIDAISQPKGGRRILRERKYSVMEYSELVERRQVSLYFAGDPVAAEVHIETFSKPQLKPKKAESVADFAARVAVWVKEKSGKGEMVHISRHSRMMFPIEAEVAAVDQIMDMRDMCLKNGIWPGNYSPFTCPMCVHKNHCRDCAQ